MTANDFGDLAKRIALAQVAGVEVPFDAVAALNCAAEGIMVTETAFDPPGPRIVYVNPALERMTGYAAAELLGRTPRIFQGPETDHSVFGNLRAVLTAGEIWRGTARNYRKSGEGYWLQWTIAPIRDPKTGRTTHFLAVEQDVTEDRARRRALEEANERLQQADRAKSDFLAAMTHELRTPLNAIMGHAELLFSEAFGPLGDAAYKWRAGLIESEASTLLDMVNGILDFAKGSAGMLTLEVDDEDLALLARSVIDVLSSLADKRKIALVAELPERLMIRGDAMRVRQILVNVIGNALKFTPDAGRVLVSGERVRDRAILRVVDTGPGIAPEHHETIFKAFVQVDGSLGRRHQGSGLGLAITRQLVELHQGRVSVDSDKGRGATFVIEFPTP